VSGSLKVKHDNNGNWTVPVSISTAIKSATIDTKSGSWTLDNIPRGATLSFAPAFDDEGSPLIIYSNPAGNAVTSLQACITFDGSKADIAYRDIPKTESSYTFNLTNEERKVLRKGVTKGTSTTVMFYIKTVIDGNTFYSKSSARKFSLVNAFPVLNPTAIDTN
jgi:hypothetical protein